MKYTLALITSVFFMMAVTQGNSQSYDPDQRCMIDANEQCLPNVILTAIPFLRIAPDARSGALGDSGIANSPDPNSMRFNSSKLAFIDKDMSFSATFTPWLRNLGLTDVFLGYLSGYKKVDDLQTIGMSLGYFSLGSIAYTDINGISTGMGNPREFEFAVSYNRKLAENFSAGLTGKFIHSNLASGQPVNGLIIASANAFAADISFLYKKEGNVTAEGSEWTLGGALTNLGSKISYTGNINKDFLPANLGLGTALLMNFDEYNSITVSLDVNKLLVPTPINSVQDLDGNPNPEYDANQNGFPDYKEKSIFGAALSSFGDAPGGFGEEVSEVNYSLGVEYWYDKQFAVRAGYYYENPRKGDRQFITVGMGIKYNVFAMDLSYLVPTNNRRNPLDNTLRFTLQFDFEALTGNNY